MRTAPIRKNIKTTYIYGLIDPRNNQIKYIGKADDPNKRHKQHLHPERMTNKHKIYWTKSLLALNLTPELIILEIVAYGDWADAEQWWIGYFKFIGAKLTNMALGGDGLILKGKANGMYGKTHSEATRRKISKALGNGKHPWVGKKHTEETKRKMSEKRLQYNKLYGAYIHTDEDRKKISTAHKERGHRPPSPLGRKQTEETKNKISAANKGRKRTQETKDKIGATSKGRFFSEEARRKMSESRKGRVITNETRKKISLAQKGRTFSEETIKRMSEAAKLRHLKRKNDSIS